MRTSAMMFGQLQVQHLTTTSTSLPPLQPFHPTPPYLQPLSPLSNISSITNKKGGEEGEVKETRKGKGLFKVDTVGDVAQLRKEDTHSLNTPLFK